MSEIDEYEDLSLFKKTGYSRIYQKREVRKEDEEDNGEQNIKSVELPDLDFDEFDKIVENIDDGHQSEGALVQGPGDFDDEYAIHQANYELNDKINESFEIVPKTPRPISISDEPPKAASEHTPSCKGLVSDDKPLVIQQNTQEFRKEILVEIIDDESKVKNCLNRKDVVIKR